MVGTETQRELTSKFFHPIINGKNAEEIKAFLKEQDRDEIEQYLHFFNFQNNRDKEAMLRQELRRREQKDVRRAKWMDRLYGFITGILTAAASAGLLAWLR